MSGEEEIGNVVCKILLHLSYFSESKDEFLRPKETTQHGMSEALGYTTSCISKRLKLLVGVGLVGFELKHALDRQRREKTFSLTWEGERVVAMIKDAKVAGAAAMIDERLRANAAERKVAAKPVAAGA